MRTILSFLTALLLLNAGCGRSEQAAPAAPTKILQLGNGVEPSTLDPQVAAGIPEQRILSSLFEGLLGEDPQTLAPVPGAAESWKISDDGLLYEFRLRSGLQWSDGTPLTATDFVRSYERMLNPKFAAENAYMLWAVDGAEDYTKGRTRDFDTVGFRALDERTLQVRLRTPTPYLLKIIANHYAWYPVPVRAILAHGDLYDRANRWARPGTLVSNGPFQLSDWQPNQKIIVQKNTRYWDAAVVKLSEIHFHAIDDLAAEERLFRTGALHKTNQLPADKVETYRRDMPESLRVEPYLGVYYYVFNCKAPPFQDPRVRKALSMAVDREALVKIAKGGQRPAFALVYPGTAGFESRAALREDVAAAQKLLAEAGYPNGANFPAVTLQFNTSDNHRLLAEAVQEMWRKNLGIRVELSHSEWRVYRSALDRHDFQVARSGWNADYVDPHVFFEIWTSQNTYNDAQFSHPEFDAVFQRSLQAKTEAERFTAYQRLEEVLVEEAPLIPLYYYTRVYALSPRVKNWNATLLDSHPYKYLDLE